MFKLNLLNLQCRINVMEIFFNMKDTIVQIYEIQTPHEAEEMINMGVDHIGSVLLSQDSWKVSSVREAVRVAKQGARSTLIPLFSDQDTVFRTLDYHDPDIVHFCDILTNGHNIVSETCKELTDLQENVRKRFPEIKIMRAIPIAQTGMTDHIPTLELARIFEPLSDYFLIDTMLVNSAKHQPAGAFIGITGQTCDWDMSKELLNNSSVPVILAGGLSPDNVSESIRYVGPVGVDSCTQTNAVDGNGQPIRFKKDLEKVKHFVEETRKLDA